MSAMASIALLASALLSIPAHGFVHNPNTNLPAFVITTPCTRTPVALRATAGDDREEAAREDAIPTTSAGMKDLIVNLSKESTDNVRRSRLESIIVQGLEESGGGADDAAFPQLFQESLEAVGNEVQAKARELAMQRYEEKDAAETINEAAVAAASSSDGANTSNNKNGGDSPIRVETVNETSEGKIKSPLETQLWALVDMMVQSKTMIKKARGQLGSKGEFR